MRTFAEKHPGTVTAINNFAVTLGDQGGLDRAVGRGSIDGREGREKTSEPF